ncbi:MAG: glycosyltransferase family 39 protein [Acidobacteria bacterium]|nr:glycosyltransferase family 39 protein [Acidobacteriota bacterium]
MKAETVQGYELPWRIFWVALAVRVLYMTLAHTWRIRPYDDHFSFAWEAGRIARSLVTGHGFANPFRGLTGPTAWLPPVYPLIIAGVFKVFGVYTPVSAWVVLAINCIFSAATALAIWEIGLRCFSRMNAVYAAWIWALYPAAMQYSVRWMWEMSITTCLFAWIFVLALRLRDIDTSGSEKTGAIIQASGWMAFGILWGIVGLSNSSLLIFLPACGLWILAGTWRKQHAIRDAALSALLFIACLAPWEARNYAVFHRFIPIRGNLGAEAALGNGPGARGLLMEYNHPEQATDQLRLYSQMGEVRYVEMRGRLASDTIRANPAHYLANVMKRIYFFWVSVPSDNRWPTELPRTLNFSFISLAGLLGLWLALYRRISAAWLFAWAFLLLPVPYYLVTVHARFRHPLEPLIAVLGVFLFQSAERRQRA